jgi:aspartyl-tRNA(Asn)/glutamyl-tRNA(Gln) amidotransferase subunit C
MPRDGALRTLLQAAHGWCLEEHRAASGKPLNALSISSKRLKNIHHEAPVSSRCGRIHLETSLQENTMSIDAKAIEKVAKLARIRIDETDVPNLSQRLNNILAMVDRLQEVDTSGIEPMANPLDATQRLRADAVTEPDRRDAFLAIAPSADQGLYLVPKVIE